MFAFINLVVLSFFVENVNCPSPAVNDKKNSWLAVQQWHSVWISTENSRNVHTVSGFYDILQVKRLTVTLFSTTWSLISVFISLKYISISGSIQVVHWKEWRLVTYLLSLRGGGSDFVEKCRTKAVVIFKVSPVHWWMWCLYTITWNVCLLKAF